MSESTVQSASQSIVDRLADLPRRTGLTANAALTLFFFAVLSMGGFMFSHSLSIDEEIGLFNEDAWNLAYQGRFLIAAYFAIGRGVIPMLPYLILAICYAASYCLILDLHGLRHSWRTHLAYLVFILFPTNWLSQEFSGVAAAFGIGMLATCLAAIQTDGQLARSGLPFWRRLSLGAILLLVVAISGFQSLLTLYLALGAGSTLFKASSSNQHLIGKKVGSLRFTLLAWFIPAVAAAGLHTLVFRLLLKLLNEQPRHIGVYFRSPYFMLRTEPANYIFGNIEQFLRTYFTPGIFYGHSLFAFPLLLFGAIGLVLWIRSNSRSQQAIQSFSLLRGWPAFLTLLVLLLCPLLLNVISKPYRIPMRALMALPYVAWLASMLWLEVADKARMRRWLFAGTLLSGLLISQCLIAISHYYGARAFNFRSDQLVASTIVSAMVQPRGQTQQVPINRLLTHGALKREVPYSTAWYSVAPASFFNWDNGSNGRIVAWMRAMGVEGLKPVEDKRDATSLAPAFKTMQAWPSPNSIRIEGDTVLVKLSN